MGGPVVILVICSCARGECVCVWFESENGFWCTHNPPSPPSHQVLWHQTIGRWRKQRPKHDHRPRPYGLLRHSWRLIQIFYFSLLFFTHRNSIKYELVVYCGSLTYSFLGHEIRLSIFFKSDCEYTVGGNDFLWNICSRCCRYFVCLMKRWTLQWSQRCCPG